MSIKKNRVTLGMTQTDALAAGANAIDEVAENVEKVRKEPLVGVFFLAINSDLDMTFSCYGDVMMLTEAIRAVFMQAIDAEIEQL